MKVLTTRISRPYRPSTLALAEGWLASLIIGGGFAPSPAVGLVGLVGGGWKIDKVDKMAEGGVDNRVWTHKHTHTQTAMQFYIYR